MMMKTKVAILCLAVFSVVEASAQFTNFNVAGAANPGIVGTTITLNTGASAAGPAEVTTIWNDQRIDFTRSFVINFTISITAGSTPALADGITFTFQNESSTAIRISGGGLLGITNNANGSTGYNNSISAGFDVFANGPALGDPLNGGNPINNEHFEIVFNGDLGNPFTFFPVILAGNSHDVAIIWNCNDGLRYLIDGQTAGLIPAPQVLAILGTNRTFFGFTASSMQSRALKVVNDFSLDYGEEVCTCNADFDLKFHAEKGQPMRISSMGHPVQTGALESYDITSSTGGFTISGSPSFSYLLFPSGHTYEVCRKVFQTDGTECETCMEFCLPETDLNLESSTVGSGNSYKNSLPDELEKASDYLVWPNPVSDELILSGVKSAGARGIIYDALGSVVSKIELDQTGENLIDVSGIPQGTYFIRVLEGAKSYSIKFIKN